MKLLKKSATALSPWQKRFLYGTTGLLWLSGCLWLYFKYFGKVQGPYGPEANPAQPMMLKIHGAAAMGFLIIFGGLLLDHVPVGWRQNEKRVSGVWEIAMCGLLILTGWGLYYIGNEGWRSWTSGIHSVAGLLLPLVILVHVKLSHIKKRD